MTENHFVTQALRLSLLLLCEDMPDTVAGLVLRLCCKDGTSSGRIEQKDEKIVIIATQTLFKWRHFEAEVILLCVRWYLRYALS